MKVSIEKNGHKTTKDTDAAPDAADPLDILLRPIRFQVYTPFRTYSDPKNKSFLGQDGEPLGLSNVGSIALFDVGKDAYELLRRYYSKTSFERYYKFRKELQEVQILIKKIRDDGGLFDDEGENIFEVVPPGARPRVPFEQSPLDPVFKSLRGMSKRIEDDVVCVFIHSLITCLEGIGTALMELQNNSPGAVVATIASMKDLENAHEIFNNNIAFNVALSGSAKNAAKERHAKSPIAKDKEMARHYYERWRESPTLYKSNASFANDMLEKGQFVEDPRTYGKWVARWKKGDKTR